MARVFLILSFLIATRLLAQDIKPIGTFLADSIKIGEPLKFSLSVKHPSATQLLFPDSGYNFAPFELVDKEYFPTVTQGNQSFDSAVYILRTFSLQPGQFLSLPVFTFEEGDSSSCFSAIDTIYLKQYLPEIPVSLDLKEQAQLHPVKPQFNYPHILAYLTIALSAALLLYFLFGKTVQRRYKLFKIRSDHMSFEKNYRKLQEEFMADKGIFTIEQALSSWKAYLARLENKPINTYTSTEIIDLYNKEELKNGLTIIDKAIYGGVISEEAEKALITLKRFSNRLYHKRKKKIQNA